MNDDLTPETGVDAVFYCPHYKEVIVKKYAIECICRKPEIGMIKNVFKDYAISMIGSYMDGDKSSDIMLGQNAGLNDWMCP